MVQLISLDKETFKALAGETRVQILKELNERRKTQSELAAKLNLSAPTVNEHLLLLKKASLVEEIDDGHKWKYFSLTRKGKSIFNPGDAKIMLVLSVLSVAFVGLLLITLSQLSSTASFSSVDATRAPVLGAANEATKALAGAPGDATGSAACNAVSAAQQLPLGQIALLVLGACFIGLLAGYLLRKR